MGLLEYLQLLETKDHFMSNEGHKYIILVVRSAVGRS